jgi:hypothetical protein
MSSEGVQVQRQPEAVEDQYQLSAVLGYGGRSLSQAGIVAANRIKGYLQFDELDSHDGEWTDGSMVRGQALAFRLSIGVPAAKGKMSFDTLEGSYPADRAAIEAFAQRHPSFFGDDARIAVQTEGGAVYRSLRAQHQDEDVDTSRTSRYQDYDDHGEGEDEREEEPDDDRGDEIEVDADGAPLEEKPEGVDQLAGGVPLPSDHLLFDEGETGPAAEQPQSPLAQPALASKEGPPSFERTMSDAPSDPTRLTASPLSKASDKPQVVDVMLDGGEFVTNPAMRGRLIRIHPDRVGQVDKTYCQNTATQWEQAVDRLKNWQSLSPDEQDNANRKFKWQRIQTQSVRESAPEFSRASNAVIAEAMAEDWRHFERVKNLPPNERYVGITTKDGATQYGIVRHLDSGEIVRDGMWITEGPQTTTPKGDAKFPLVQQAQFRDGQLHGQVRNYSSEQFLADRQEYANGHKHGIGIEYKREKDPQTGKDTSVPALITTYQHGEVVAQKVPPPRRVGPSHADINKGMQIG